VLLNLTNNDKLLSNFFFTFNLYYFNKYMKFSQSKNSCHYSTNFIIIRFYYHNNMHETYSNESKLSVPILNYSLFFILFIIIILIHFHHYPLIHFHHYLLIHFHFHYSHCLCHCLHHCLRHLFQFPF
jgi:hypothetical protein